jgi:hypothetical protein
MESSRYNLRAPYKFSLGAVTRNCLSAHFSRIGYFFAFVDCESVAHYFYER